MKKRPEAPGTPNVHRFYRQAAEAGFSASQVEFLVVLFEQNQESPVIAGMREELKARDEYEDICRVCEVKPERWNPIAEVRWPEVIPRQPPRQWMEWDRFRLISRDGHRWDLGTVMVTPEVGAERLSALMDGQKTPEMVPTKRMEFLSRQRMVEKEFYERLGQAG